MPGEEEVEILPMSMPWPPRRTDGRLDLDYIKALREWCEAQPARDLAFLGESCINALFMRANETP